MAKDKERPDLIGAVEIFRNDLGVEEFNKGVQEIVDKVGFTTKQAEFLLCINLSLGHIVEPLRLLMDMHSKYIKDGSEDRRPA